jgi:hypothetical protein
MQRWLRSCVAKCMTATDHRDEPLRVQVGRRLRLGVLRSLLASDVGWTLLELVGAMNARPRLAAHVSRLPGATRLLCQSVIRPCRRWRQRPSTVVLP